MSIKKKILLVVGFISFAIGAVAAAIPLLPSFPFLMLACVCFAKSSEKFHNWFISTSIYKNNLESYVKGKGMSKQAKLRVIATITVFILIGLFVMRNAPIYAKAALGIVWLFHVLYFVFRVKGNKT